MKKAIAIIVFGLLWCSNAYAADCNQASGAITGTVLIPDTTQYVCETDDIFILDAGVHSTAEEIRLDLNTNNPTDVTIENSGTIYRTDTPGSVIKGTGSNRVTLTNKPGATIQGEAQGIFIDTGSNWTVDNYGTIYGKSAKGFNIKRGDNNKITNRSEGVIKSDGANAIFIWGTSSDDGENTIIENYGTIKADRSTIKVGDYSSGTTITNYSGATIEATKTDAQQAAVQIDGDNTTITNKGTISAAGLLMHSIEISDDVTGTKIYVDGAPTFTGEIDLNNAAANTTMYLGCNMTQDTTIEIHNHGGSLNIENNLCGNDTYTLSTESLDEQQSDSDDGYLIIDEGLEVVSYNAKYRSENVSTKLKGLFNAANYINSGGPEDKFFRVFYSSVKRENMYKGSMAGVVGQLSPINWGSITSNIFLGYSKHDGDFDNGEFLGGGNYALGLKNVFTKNGVKISFSPMIGLNDLDVTDYDSDSGAKVKTNLLSEFLAINGKIDKEIKTSEEGSLNISVQSTLGMQRFSDYISKFSDGDLSVDESVEQILSGGFEVKYNEELGKGFIIRPYVGVSLNRNLNDNIAIVADDDNTSTSPAYSVTSGYYVGLTLNKEAKDINFDLDLMYGNEDGLINQIAAVAFTKSFGKAKKETIKLEPVPDLPKIDESLTTQDYNKTFKELEMLRDLNKKIKVENAKLKAQNEKLKLLAQKTLEENEVSKKLIVELLKENEKVKLENQIFKNRILENENKELIEQLEGSNAGNKPSGIFLLMFGTIFAIGVLGSAKIITLSFASIYNRIMYRPVRA